MPPRYAFWTILIDGKATAFRAREKEELLPTFQQLKRTNKDVVFKWFARGRLWETPEESQAALRAPRVVPEKRGGAWRPGGTHADPRARFKKKSGARSHDTVRLATEAAGRPHRASGPPAPGRQTGERLGAPWREASASAATASREAIVRGARKPLAALRHAAIVRGATRSLGLGRRPSLAARAGARAAAARVDQDQARSARAWIAVFPAEWSTISSRSAASPSSRCSPRPG